MKRDGCHKQIVREKLLDGAARFASQTSIRTFLVIEREIAAGTLALNENYLGDSPIVLPEGYVCKAE